MNKKTEWASKNTNGFQMHVAAELGVNAAVIYAWICGWCHTNASSQRNIRDGRVWTYNSVANIQKSLPCFSVAQIKFALRRLVEAKYIEAGNFNRRNGDRTTWYADLRFDYISNIDVNPVAVENSQRLAMGSKSLAMGSKSLAMGSQPLPIYLTSHTYTQTKENAAVAAVRVQALDVSQQEPKDLRKIEAKKRHDDKIDEAFGRLWNAWPKKDAKAVARKAFGAAVGKKKQDPEALIVCAARWVAGQRSDMQAQFYPMLATWLNQERWTDPAAQASTERRRRDQRPSWEEVVR